MEYIESQHTKTEVEATQAADWLTKFDAFEENILKNSEKR
jgi:hypothetical protein